MRRRDLLKAGAISLATASIPKMQTAKAADEVSSSGEAVGTNSELLKEQSITHGGLQSVAHPGLGVKVTGQTAIRYLRFGRPVHIDRLELGRLAYGRYEPGVPCHPAHLLISVLDRESGVWRAIREVDLPPEPKMWGEGLNQEMSIEAMNEHFSSLIIQPGYTVQLGGIETDHLRVVCDREHPTWPNHGENNGGIFNVPFGILNKLTAWGKPATAGPARALYHPPLKMGSIKPSAPKGMVVRNLPTMLLYEGRYLSLGFSLHRPMLMHLGWDVLGEGQAGNNRLLVSRQQKETAMIGGMSGPILRTLLTDMGAHLWTGQVSVVGNRVIYEDLRAIEGLRLDATFMVEKDHLSLDLVQHSQEEIPVIEAEAWRLVWNMKAGITGLAGLPSERAGRNGDVSLPVNWASDGVGCLSCSLVAGKTQNFRLQAESYRFQDCTTSGFVLGSHPGPDSCQVIPAGEHGASLRMGLTSFEPFQTTTKTRMSAGLRRHWGTVFSCYRPEYRGFSNHAASVNCHLSQGPPVEIAVFTRRPKEGPDPIALARFTIGKALLDGGGYGYHRNLYLDSDPVLLSAAGRIHQADPDLDWLRRIEPGVLETVERMARWMGEEGLVICRDLSGNSGSYRWSTNSMDVIGFGHLDAYVNAWSYRALRNAAALLEDLHRTQEALRCREDAQRIRAAYSRLLLNPETGWVAGWRSRDGELHDYGFLWVNGVALAFGLLESEVSMKALAALEKKRGELGPRSARLGLPLNLFPIRAEDQMLPRIIPDASQPTFETYTDGSLSGWTATYYLRALSIHGLKAPAQRIADEMAEGYAEGVFNGGNGSGHEFRSWEGLPTGYEGTLIGCFGPLYAIAIEQGAFLPPSPEWWPANG